jgi:hypothetical protein
MRRQLNSVFVSISIASAALTAFATPRYAVKFTVAGYGGATGLENFPVLVKLAERDATAGTGIVGFNYADMSSPSTGADLWFSSDAAGATVIPHDIDEWHSDGTSLVWVSVPKMANGSTFYMHYNDSAPPTYAPSNVWLRANYVGVWHMNEASGNVADATGHGLTAVPKGTRASTDSIGVADGPIGTCRQNSQSSSRGSGNNNCFLQVATSPFLDAINNYCTASQWVKFTSVSCNNVRIYSRKTGNADSKGFECEMGSASSVTIRAGGSSSIALSLSPVGQWVHFAAVYDSTLCYGYGNGGATSKSGTITQVGNRTGIGYGLGSDADGSEWCINGWMDEYRLRSVASSADWVKAEYQTATVAGFVTASAVADESAAVVVAGSPFEYGTPSPAYGVDAGHSVGDSLRLTAPASIFLNSAETERALCTGWKLYDRATGVLESQSAAGDDPTVCAFQYAGPVTLVWQWRHQYLVSISASAGGTATQSFWSDVGDSATVTATPDAGCAFYGWNGDTEAIGINWKSSSASFTVTAPIWLTAMFTGAEPVAKTYTGANNGAWDVASNWTPAGIPSVTDDVTIPNSKRVAAGRRIFAHSITLEGSGAISQGGATTAYDASCDFTGASSYGTTSNYGRKADDFTSTALFQVEVISNVTMNSSSQWIVGGHNSPAYKTVSIGGNLTLSGTAKFAIYAGKGDMANEPEKGGALLSVGGTATIGSGTLIDAFCNVNVVGCGDDRATGAYVMLSFGDTVVAEGGVIRSRVGVATFTETALKQLGCPATSGNSLAGGGHGGSGGRGGGTSSTATSAGGATYDYELSPILPGAAGSIDRSFGGGAVRLDTGSLTLNGTISSKALYSNGYERGTPAGGSIWITCEEYEMGQNALLTADGLNGAAYSSYNIGGGGGGRIAIATGLSAAQKTELARTGTTDDISTTTSLVQIHPGNVSVTAGIGILNGTAGEDGTAVLYSFLDSSQVSVAIATSPTGLDDPAFSPAANAVELVARGSNLSATAPQEIALPHESRRLGTRWEATLGNGTVFASGTGTNAVLQNISDNVTLTWYFETLQYAVDIRAVGDGAVTGAASGWFNDGVQLTLAATPSAGAAFKGWISGFYLKEAEAAATNLTLTVDRSLRVAGVFSGTPSLSAKTYVGASGGSWDDGANWSPAGIPDATDAVTIPDNTVVAVGESATAGSLSLGEDSTLSVFGKTTAFYETISVLSINRANLGRYAADSLATNIYPSIEVAGDLTAGTGSSIALGGFRQRGQSLLSVFGNLTLGSNARLSIYAGQTVPGRIAYLDGTGSVRVGGTLSLASGARLNLLGYFPIYNDYNTISGIPVTCGALEVAAGARITSNFPYRYNPGSPVDSGIGGGDGRVAGGGHGGAGGAGSFGDGTNRANGGRAWDSPYAPLYPGSMGRANYDSGSIGGGAIRITTDDIRLDGEINADAIYGGAYEYGGAPGGSIWLICRSFRAGQTAKLSAKASNGGAYSTYNSGGGGGGRISICKGLGAAQIDALKAGGTPSGSILVADNTVADAKYRWLGDVSGGSPAREGEPGSEGTFVILSPASLRIFLQ